MNMRAITFGVAVTLVVGVGLAFFVLSRPAPIADHHPAPVDAAQVALAGWRQSPDGPVLVLPTPEGGVEARVRGPTWFEPLDAAVADIAAWPPLPDAPYAVRAVQTRSDDGVAIAATLLLPPTPRAGAVIVHGSGDSDRRNKWYLDIADDLARSGIAVWFPDKRGTGASGGRWRDASFRTLALDAVAGREALIAALGGSAAPPVGYVGISQGGWIAPLAAQAAPTPFVVVLSSAAVTPNEQVDHEVRADLARALPGVLVPLVLPVARRVPRWRYPAFWAANGDLDPVAEIVASGAPTLVLLGDQDEFDNVPVARSIELYEAARAHGADIRVLVVAGGGHDLSPGPDSGPIDRPALAQVRDFIIGASPRL